MIFATNGFAVDQKQIVSAVFGGAVCSGGLAGVIGSVLSSNWIDNNTGKQFSSDVSAAYDSIDGVYNINNAIIVNELANNQPLLYANQHHAMVIVQADFFGPPQNPTIQAIYVLDPWPWSPSFHQLTQPETIPDNAGGQMTFLASVATW